MLKEEKKELLKKLIEKHKDTFIFHSKNILWDVLDQIQKLIQFAFISEDKEIPQIILGDDNYEKNNNESRNSIPNGQIFIKLNRRSYHSQTSNDRRKLFQDEGVLLAGTPILHEKKSSIENPINETPELKSFYFSDNEFIFTIKTKTIKQQYEMLNILERTLNVYARRLTDNFVNVSGISNIKVKEKKDKDDLETLEIYYQFRLQEVTSYNKYYVIDAFKIIFDNQFGEEEIVNWINSDTIFNKNEAITELKTLTPDYIDKKIKEKKEYEIF